VLPPEDRESRRRDRVLWPREQQFGEATSRLVLDNQLLRNGVCYRYSTADRSEGFPEPQQDNTVLPQRGKR
jgi:hypothetical protein